MRRREFLTGLAVTSLAAPLAGETQEAGRVYRLGILSPAASPAAADRVAAVLVPRALRELGYVEGQNLTIERRFAAGRPERLAALVRELVRLRVEVIHAVSPPAVQAAKDATRTIPIVMGFSEEPVALGFVASLARPGGNITGVTLSAQTLLAGKRLEMLREMVPKANRIAVLTTDDLGSRAQVKEAEKAAAQLGVKAVVVEAKGRDYEGAFATIKADRVDALFVVSNTTLNTDRKRIIELAAKHQLPAIYEWRHHVAEDGGLMAYGSDLLALSRRVAIYIDRLFKGANPAELPVEQPTKFELVINMRTAKALGLTIPQSLVLRADQIVE